MLAYVKINSLYDEEDKEMLNVYFSSTIIALFVTVFSIKLVFFARASYNFMVISLFSIPFCWKKIKGKDLKLNRLLNNEIMIHGQIFSIELNNYE